MEAVLQEGGDSEEAMGEDHCHHGPSLVAPSPSNGRYSYLHSSLNKMYLSSICIYSASVSQPVDTESVTAGLEDLQLGQGNNCLAINVSICSKLYTQLCTHVHVFGGSYGDGEQETQLQATRPIGTKGRRIYH